MHKLIPIALLFAFTSASALQPADVQITTDPAVTVKITRNKTNISKQISITVNAQDKVTQIKIAPPAPVPAPPPPPPSSAVEYDTRIGLGADAAGVPILTKDPAAQYVFWNPASAKASDANPCTDSAAPCATIAGAWAKLRNGVGDWMLMAQGSTSAEGFGSLARGSGKSAQYPTVVTTYDPADPANAAKMRRGLVSLGIKPTVGILQLMYTDTRATTNVVFENISFDAPEMNTQQVSILGVIQRNLMFHNVRFLHTSISVQGDYSATDFASQHLRGVIFRHCVVAFAATPGTSHTQGLYAWDTDGLTVEDSILYHNGWLGTDRNAPGADHGALPDIYKHNAYFGTWTWNTIFRRNVTGHASSHGLQARGGGTITDNVFASNPINAIIGAGDNYNKYRPLGVPYQFDRNVVVGSTDIDSVLARGFGVEFANTQEGGSADGNLVVNIGPTATNNRYAFTARANFDVPTVVSWTNNIEWNWRQTASWTTLPVAFPARVAVARSGNVSNSEPVSGSNLTSPVSPFPYPGRTLDTFATANGYADQPALWAAMLRDPLRPWAGQIGGYIRAGFGR